MSPAPGDRHRALAYVGASAFINVASFLYTVLCSRILGPVDYGVLASLLALLLVVGVPLNAAQLATVRAATEASPGAGVRVVLVRAIAVGAALTAAGALASPLVAKYLRLGSVIPVVVLAVYVGFAAVSTAPQGVLIARGATMRVALVLCAGSTLRLTLGLSLVTAGGGVTGALTASVVGQAVVLALLLRSLRPAPQLRTPRAHREQVRPSGADGLLALAALMGFAAFTSVDALASRRLFLPAASGFYVASATAARVALFAPGALAVVAYPRLTRSWGTGLGFRSQVRTFTLGVVAIALAVASGLCVASSSVVHLLFGPSYGEAVATLPVLAGGAALMALVEFATYANVSRRSAWALAPWIAAAAIGAVAALARPSPHALAVVVLTVAAVTAAATLLPLLVLRDRQHGADLLPGRSAADHMSPARSAEPRSSGGTR